MMVLAFPSDDDDFPDLFKSRTTETTSHQTIISGKDRYINVVVSYGDDGDTDNIADAIKMIPPDTKGRILIRAGTYPISSAITILQSNLSFEGDGDNTILSANNLGAVDVFAIGDGTNAISGISISRLKINITGTWSGEGVHIKNLASDISVENVKILGSGSIQTGATASQVWINNCYLGTGLTELGGTYIFFTNNLVFNHMECGADKSVFSNNFFDLAAAGSPFWTGDYNVISANIFFDAGEDIYIYGDYNALSGNVTKFGFNLDGAGNVEVGTVAYGIV